MGDLRILLDMGFPRDKAEKSLRETGNKGVEAATEWLLSHAEERMEETNIASSSTTMEELPPANSSAGDTVRDSEECSNETEAVVRQCDECQEKFRNAVEVSLHAIKTSHSCFTQCSEVMDPLPLDEQLKQAQELERLMKHSDNEHPSSSKNAVFGNGGPSSSSARQTFRTAAAKRKREIDQQVALDAEKMNHFMQLEKQRAEAMAERQRVLFNIEMDKLERRLKYGKLSSPSALLNQGSQDQACTESKLYDTCRLQIRLPDGKTLIHTFDSQEELAAVRLYVDMHRTDGRDPFALMTNFPKRVFTDEDMARTLSCLGLPPSAMIIVRKTPCVNL